MFFFLDVRWAGNGESIAVADDRKTRISFPSIFLRIIDPAPTLDVAAYVSVSKLSSPFPSALAPETTIASHPSSLLPLIPP